MDIRQILNHLRAERERINKAIAALGSLGGAANSSNRTACTPVKASTAPKRRRRMSAATRKRMSKLMKKRWASGKMKG